MFILNGGCETTRQLCNLPAGIITNISFVAMRQSEITAAYLPSLAAGPIYPGMLCIVVVLTVLLFIYHIYCCHYTDSPTGGSVDGSAQSVFYVGGGLSVIIIMIIGVFAVCIIILILKNHNLKLMLAKE